ncbi:MAG: multicopper oxidase domain-containing protein, partial [Candidatus Eremiobacteraeota bacterium]|nr:multicopper oxidase domain-containing protein [Candidatus Eremiobacteraeota bacterium]
MKLVLFLGLLLLGVASPQLGAIVPNDNRVPAGTLTNQVLRISLEAASGTWSPDGIRSPGIVIQAFRENGHPLQIPGPLVRVPLGTIVEARIRNALSTSITVHGFNDRPGQADATVRIAPGEEQLVRFRANAAGTYYY